MRFPPSGSYTRFRSRGRPGRLKLEAQGSLFPDVERDYYERVYAARGIGLSLKVDHRLRSAKSPNPGQS